MIATNGPALSLVVIVYNMPMQAEKTLYSLTAEYQQGVKASDYEVIVVENESTNNLDRAFVSNLPDNFSYHLRAEREPTPVHAINHGVGISRGRYVCRRKESSSPSTSRTATPPGTTSFRTRRTLASSIPRNWTS